MDKFVEQNNVTDLDADLWGQLEFVRNYSSNVENYTLLMHVCPGIKADSSKMQLLQSYQDKLYAALINKPQQIFCGHTHWDTFKLWHGIPALNVPGFSAKNLNNPGYRYANFSDDGKLLDYI